MAEQFFHKKQQQHRRFYVLDGGPQTELEDGFCVVDKNPDEDKNLDPKEIQIEHIPRSMLSSFDDLVLQIILNEYTLIPEENHSPSWGTNRWFLAMRIKAKVSLVTDSINRLIENDFVLLNEVDGLITITPTMCGYDYFKKYLYNKNTCKITSVKIYIHNINELIEVFTQKLLKKLLHDIVENMNESQISELFNHAQSIIAKPVSIPTSPPKGQTYKERPKIGSKKENVVEFISRVYGDEAGLLNNDDFGINDLKTCDEKAHRALYNISPPEKRDAALKSLNLLKVGEKIDKKIAEIGSGEIRRLAVAVQRRL